MRIQLLSKCLVIALLFDQLNASIADANSMSLFYVLCVEHWTQSLNLGNGWDNSHQHGKIGHEKPKNNLEIV